MPSERGKRQREKDRSRSNSSYERKSKNRPQRPIILIVCGGLETERIYFEELKKYLKLGTLNVIEVIGEGLDPFSLVQYATNKREDRKIEAKKAKKKGVETHPLFEEVWCVIDREARNEDASFDRAIDTAKGRDIQVAVSNPAFEYWFLLHFKETAQPFQDADDLIRALKHSYIPDYEKSLNIFSRICEQTDFAIERASRFYNQYVSDEELFPNPSTQVFKLLQMIKKILPD